MIRNVYPMTESLVTAFEIITKNLTQTEITALQKFSATDSDNNIVELFFQELITCNIRKESFLSSPKWRNLSKEEKLVLGDKVLAWYTTIVSFQPDYEKRCFYSMEDDLKLRIALQGEDLVSKADYDNYKSFLLSTRLEKYKEGYSAEFISWLDVHIYNIDKLLKMEFPLNSNRDTNLTNYTDPDGEYIFPNEIIKVLKAYYYEFNGRIFEEMPLEVFLKIFLFKGESKIKFKEDLQGHFNYSLSKIEDKHQIIKGTGGFEEWYGRKIGGRYRNHKKRPSKNQDLLHDIDVFFNDHLT